MLVILQCATISVNLCYIIGIYKAATVTIHIFRSLYDALLPFIRHLIATLCFYSEHLLLVHISVYLGVQMIGDIKCEDITLHLFTH